MYLLSDNSDFFIVAHQGYIWQLNYQKWSDMYLDFYLLISDYAFNDHKAISQLERDSNKVSNKYC